MAPVIHRALTKSVFARLVLLCSSSGFVACGGSTDIAPVPEVRSNGVDVELCTGSAPKAIFLVTMYQQIFAFDPVHSVFARVGKLDCGLQGAPIAGMAIGHDGTGYTLLPALGGPQLCRFDLRTGKGSLMSFYPGQQALEGPSLAFAPDVGTHTESLRVLASTAEGITSLARLNLDTFRLSAVQPLTASLPSASFSIDETGRGLVLTEDERATALFELDLSSGKIVSRRPIDLRLWTQRPAFVAWENQLFVFRGGVVYRLDAASADAYPVAEIPGYDGDSYVAAVSTVNCNVAEVANEVDEGAGLPLEQCWNVARSASYLRSGSRLAGGAQYGPIPLERFSRVCGAYGFSSACALYESCLISCSADVECPALFDTKKAECRTSSANDGTAGRSACVLPCQVDADCPTGLRCIPDASFGSSCLWEYPFEAAPISPPI